MRAFALLCLLLPGCLTFSTWSGIESDSFGQGKSRCKTPSACDCCSMLQEVEKLRVEFNLTLDHLQSEHIEMLKQLQDTIENRTAFTVSLHNKRFSCVGPYQEDTIIPYKHIILNLGSDYDDESGVFVAPHSGYYIFAVTIHSDAGSSGSPLVACAQLYVNNVVKLSLSEVNDADQADSATNVVVLELKAQDMVSVHLPAGCFLCDDNNHHNLFSGFLAYTID